jgi:putative tricarboxylic transport membrane protein
MMGRWLGGVRAPQDFAGGLFLIGIAAVGFWMSLGLATGTLTQMGPGMLPRSLSVLCAILGVALLIESLLTEGLILERWSLRGPLFILGAVVAFGLTVRPLGLAVAGPITIIVSAFGSNETRWHEVIIFALIMTAFCLGLFKWLLGLPVPVAPWLIGY